MDVERILRNGYFDKLKIDGYIKPIFESNGTCLIHNESFKVALNKSNESFKHGLANLRINIYGEASTDIALTELDHIRNDRNSAGIPVTLKSKHLDTGIVAYADILILKGGYALPFELKANGKNENSIRELVITEDKKELIIAAIKLSEYISSISEYSSDWVNIAIIDKVYVVPIFRRCGISKWIHENIADIINMYSMVFPLGIVQMYGDFSNEANKLFGLSTEQYNKMLFNHYKSLGYNKITKLKLKDTPNNDLILYKLFI